MGKLVSISDNISSEDKYKGEYGNWHSPTIHTDVEVRDGRKERAAKSSDNVLDNAGPVPSWHDKGYIIE